MHVYATRASTGLIIHCHASCAVLKKKRSTVFIAAFFVTIRILTQVFKPEKFLICFSVREISTEEQEKQFYLQ